MNDDMSKETAKRIMKKIAEEWAAVINKSRHDFLLKKAKEFVNKPSKPTTK